MIRLLQPQPEQALRSFAARWGSCRNPTREFLPKLHKVFWFRVQGLGFRAFGFEGLGFEDLMHDKHLRSDACWKLRLWSRTASKQQVYRVEGCRV